MCFFYMIAKVFTNTGRERKRVTVCDTCWWEELNREIRKAIRKGTFCAVRLG